MSTFKVDNLITWDGVKSVAVAAIADAVAAISAKFDKTGGDISGNVNFAGTGRRITADFSNATHINRFLFQSSTANTATSVGAIPSGTGQSAAFNAYSSSDTANASFIQMRAGADTGDARIASLALGTGTLLPLASYIGATKNTEQPVTGGFLVTGGALGYGTGTGGTATQATNKATGVTLNKPSGQITMNSSALAAGAAVVFTVSNSYALSTSLVDVCGAYNPGAPDPSNYRVELNWSGNGAFSVRVTNISSGTLSDALVINFQLMTGSTS